MTITVHRFENAARYLPLALDGLIAVGVAADHDRRRRIARLRQLPLQGFDGINLCRQLGFEIEARRISPVGVAWPGVAIDAAVLASAVGVDGRSKPISGKSLVAMIVLATSSRTSVLKASSSGKLSQPSSKTSRRSGSKRPVALDTAPRPRAGGRRPARFRSRVSLLSKPLRQFSWLRRTYKEHFALFSTRRLRYQKPMISVIIPTLNAAPHLPATFLSIFDAAIDGFVSEVIVSDGGSTDATRAIAEDAGATVIAGERGRGQQLRAGADAARKPWLLFLHADTALDSGWADEARVFMKKGGDAAAAFRFRLADSGFQPRLLEAAVALRCRLFRFPYGDQGLLISRTLYDAIGGFAPIPLMEDVDIVRKLGRRRLAMLKTAAVTSPERFRRDGYFRRSLSNLTCLMLYYRGVPPERLAERYG